MSYQRRQLVYWLVICALSAVPVVTRAAAGYSTWTGSSSTAWGTAGNWNPAVAPGGNTNVFIDKLSGNMPSITSGSNACRYLWISTNASTGPNTVLSISGGGQFGTTAGSSSENAPGASHNGNNIGILAGATGGVSITGANSLWSDNYGVYIGDNGTGSLILRNGGGYQSLGSGGGWVIGFAAGGNGTVVMADSGTWANVKGAFAVGTSGTASLSVTNGAALTNSGSPVTLGNSVGGSGTVLVSGTGSKWISTSSSVTIGSSGWGTLTVADGGTLTTPTATIGYNASSKGLVTVTGSSSSWIHTGTTLAVGSSSTNATLILAEGGTVNVGSSTGTVNLGNTAVSGAVGTAIHFGAPPGSDATTPGTLLAGKINGNTGTGPKWVSFNHTSSGLTFAIPMTGTLRVWQSGPGTTILTATNTYTGGTLISAGTLAIGAGGTDGSLLGNITNHASLVFNRSDSLGCTGSISGSGSLIKNGAGILTLSGSNTFSGGLTVNSGTLNLSNANSYPLTGTGPLTMAAGTSLTGVGHVGGNATIVGTLSPGNSAGTLIFDQNLALASGSATALELADAGTFDRVVVSGGFTPGGTLNVTLLGGYDPADGASFDLIDWGSLPSGTFATVNLPALSGGRSWDTSELYTTGTIRVALPAPTLSGIVAVPADGTYRVGQTLSFTATFTANLTVVGTDCALRLTIGSTTRSATYSSKTANSVTFSYTVQAGDFDTNGISVDAITLNTTTLRDSLNRDADLTLTGHLPSTSGILVDTLSPAPFSVINSLDSGAGSFRQAILDAEACGQAALITFNNNLGSVASNSPLPALTTPTTIDFAEGNAVLSLRVGTGGAVRTTGGTGGVTGPTTVEAGTLTVDGGGLTGSRVTVDLGGRLAGAGSVGGLNLNHGATLAPGPGPAAIQAGEVTWSGGGSYEWQINDATGTAGGNNGWDWLNLAGQLTIAATGSDRFTVKVATLTPPGNAPGGMGNFDATQFHAWNLVTAGGGILGFDPNRIDLDTSDVANNLAGGALALTQVGQSIHLTFAPAANHAPLAQPLTASVRQGESQTLSASKLLSHATDADADALSLTGVSAGSTNATVSLASGQITYTPRSDFWGIDTFTYSISDGRGGAATATVTVTVRTADTFAAPNLVYGPQIEDGQFVVRFAGVPGTTYTIEATDSLSPPNWQKKANLAAPTAPGALGVGIFEFRESAGGATSRYFRTRWPAY